MGDIDTVKGYVVGIPVFEKVCVTDCVYEAVGDIDTVKGKVVGIAVFDCVCVTDCVYDNIAVGENVMGGVVGIGLDDIVIVTTAEILAVLNNDAEPCALNDSDCDVV